MEDRTTLDKFPVAGCLLFSCCKATGHRLWSHPETWEFHWNMTFTCRQTYIVPHWIHLRIGNVSDKSCRGTQNTHFMFNSLLPPPPPPKGKSRCLWRDVQKYATARQVADGSKIRRMGVACWTPKATDTQSDTSFPRTHMNVTFTHTFPVLWHYTPIYV